jgi:hypothetical protein
LIYRTCCDFFRKYYFGKSDRKGATSYESIVTLYWYKTCLMMTDTNGHSIFNDKEGPGGATININKKQKERKTLNILHKLLKISKAYIYSSVEMT